MLDAVIVSDLHLGSSNSQTRSLCSFLEGIADGSPATARLILNGDVFDSFDFRRLGKSHWKVLSLLRKLSDPLEIIWIAGNHDGSAEVVSHLLGVAVKDEYVLLSGGRRILVLHGHTFDDFIDAHPVLTWLGDCAYALLQRLDRTHTMARMAKRGSKTFLRCAGKVEEGAIRYARGKNCTAVCCGHTHFPAAKEGSAVAFYNGGSWTEFPCTYLTVADGCVRLHCYDEQPAERMETVPAAAEVLSAQAEQW